MKKGYILVAAPSIVGDLSFHRTVVVLVDNTNETLMGFVINKKLDYSLNEVANQLKKSFPLYYGGPVETDSLFFIYNSKVKVSGSMSICKNLNWGGDFDEIVKLINDDKISKEDIKFFLGYSGWNPNQLKNEMKDKNWEIFKNIDQDLVLSNETEGIWKNYLNSIGGEYLIWSNSPENPNHN